MEKRIIEILKYKELSAHKFAEIMEVQASSISHIVSGRNKPSFDFIAKSLDRFPEINPDWLILGKGGMLRQNDSSGEKSVCIDYDNMIRLSEKAIERIIILYKDKSFDTYES